MERLIEAKQLLLFTGSSVNEICYQLGSSIPPISAVSSSATYRSLRGSTVSVNRVCVERGIGLLAFGLVDLVRIIMTTASVRQNGFYGERIALFTEAPLLGMFN
ncbi:hypothetical protein D3C71_1417760 [compost metagenome]